MSNDFVTLTSLINETQAYVVVNRLKEIGIAAIIEDAKLVGTDPLFGNIVHWINVQVREQDVEQAVVYLEQANSDRSLEADASFGQDEAESHRDEYDLNTRLAQEYASSSVTRTLDTTPDPLVEKSLRFALFGAIFLPLTFVSIALLLWRLIFCPTKMTPLQKGRTFLAFYIDAIVLVVEGYFFSLILKAILES